MQTKLETITPQAAKLLLGNNNRNRNLKPGLIDIIARDILSGDFMVTHQGLAIDEDGMLLDGQHRLAAIVKANKPVQIYVSRGLPGKVMNVVDTGAKRTQGDALSIAGYENTLILASAGQIYASLLGESEFTLTDTRRMALNNFRMLNFIEQHPELIEAVRWVVSNKRAKQLGSASIVAAFYAYFHITNKNKAREFFRALADNFSLEQNHPAIVLNEHILRRKAQKIALSRKYITAAIIRSWRNFLTKNYGTNIVILDPIQTIREFTESKRKQPLKITEE